MSPRCGCEPHTRPSFEERRAEGDRVARIAVGILGDEEVVAHEERRHERPRVGMFERLGRAACARRARSSSAWTMTFGRSRECRRRYFMLRLQPARSLFVPAALPRPSLRSFASRSLWSSRGPAPALRRPPSPFARSLSAKGERAPASRCWRRRVEKHCSTAGVGRASRITKGAGRLAPSWEKDNHMYNSSLHICAKKIEFTFVNLVNKNLNGAAPRQEEFRLRFSL